MKTRKETCENVIIEALQSNLGQWVKKVELFTIAYEKGGYSPETTCPILRRLEREGKITKGTYNGQYRNNLIQYCMGTPTKPFTRWEEITKDDGTRVMIPVTIIR